MPDTSVLVSGRLSMLVEQGELSKVHVIIPEAVLSELEHHARQGRESGVTGLDEVSRLQELAGPAGLKVSFAGERPHPEDLEMEEATELRALARQVAVDHEAELVTSERVQAHVSRARGLKVWYLHAYGEAEGIEAERMEDLEVFQFFTDDDFMSVHLKADVIPTAKKGTPGKRTLEAIGHTPLTHAELSRMAREIIEAARRNPDSFVEIERPGATVCQLGPMRVAIARPPFSDGLEITAVRPVVRLSLEDYDLPDDVLAKIVDGNQGVFVSGPPGSGKSTFAQAIADHLHLQGTVVKTMESPRDLQVDPAITQYAPLEGSMELTSDVLLLVRPDYVIYDEVRKTDDFEVFGDMRLAGVGLIGVTHSNRAIDAVQRMLGRVELGMIPQIVDTVVHILGGEIQQILELKLTVKVPAGMQEADLARPVVVVYDQETRRPEYELYTYGEQVVVMPLSEIEGGGRGGKGARRDQLAENQLVYLLRRHIDGDFEVEVTGANRATVYVEQDEIAQIIGSGGSNVKRLEQQLGVKLDIKTFDEMEDAPWNDDDRNGGGAGNGGGGGGGMGRFQQRDAAKRASELRPQVRKTKKHLVLVLEPWTAGETAEVCIDGEFVFEATVGRKGEIRVRRESPEGQSVLSTFGTGEVLSVRV